MSEVRGRIEDTEPYWRLQNADALARVISGVCGIRKEVADQIVTELLSSESKTAQFETQTILTVKPKLSRTTSEWVAREVTWSGISEHTGYELRRIRRTEG